RADRTHAVQPPHDARATALHPSVGQRGAPALAALHPPRTDVGAAARQTTAGRAAGRRAQCGRLRIAPCLNLSKPYRHSVYVIELDERVLNHRRFREANPGRDILKPCLYVGATGLSVEQRFANHKRGYKANRYVQLYGIRLRPEFYACFNPMPYHAALTMEVELAEDLRDQGYAVWQG